MKKWKGWWRPVTHVLLVFLVQLVSRAGEDMGGMEKTFRLSVTPYAWLFDLKGTVGARGYSTHIDAKFTESTKHLNFAGMVSVDAVYKNTFGFNVNGNLAVLSGDGTLRGVSLDSSSSLLLCDATAFYRAASIPFGVCRQVLNIDVLAGVRVWRAGLKLDVALPGGNRQFAQNALWVDPLLGARMAVTLNEKWNLRFQGGYGGFSTGSKRTWDAAAIVGYAVRRNIRLVAGYRAVGVDYWRHSGRERLVFDVTLKGPIVGAVISF